MRNFPWPKSMRWGTGTLKWVRPLQSIICLLSDEAGAEVVPLTIDGITAGRSTRGHRFLSPHTFTVNGFDDYEAKLKRAHVILRADERAEVIWNDATQQALHRASNWSRIAGFWPRLRGWSNGPSSCLAGFTRRFWACRPRCCKPR